MPSPVDVGSTGRGDTDTGDRRDERVGRRDVGRVGRTPHHPDGSTGEGTSEGEHLHAGIVAERLEGDNFVLDRVGGTGANSEGT